MSAENRLTKEQLEKIEELLNKIDPQHNHFNEAFDASKKMNDIYNTREDYKEILEGISITMNENISGDNANNNQSRA